MLLRPRSRGTCFTTHLIVGLLQEDGTSRYLSRGHLQLLACRRRRECEKEYSLTTAYAGVTLATRSKHSRLCRGDLVRSSGKDRSHRAWVDAAAAAQLCVCVGVGGLGSFRIFRFETCQQTFRTTSAEPPRVSYLIIVFDTTEPLANVLKSRCTPLLSSRLLCRGLLIPMRDCVFLVWFPGETGMSGTT